MVAGLFHPSILFPANLLEALEEAELDQIGLHEAAHVARGDDRALLVQRVIEALLLLHPVVRWIARRIDLEREIACDDFVVQAAGNPLPYATCLTRVAEITNGIRGPIVAAAAADERSHLALRVDMLLDRSRPTGTRPLTARLAAVITVIASMAWVGTQAPGMIVFAMPAMPVFAPAARTLPQPAALPPTQAASKPSPQETPRPAARPVRQKVSAQVVTIPVVVRDPRNRVVTGLDKSAFRLFEDGAEQEITAVRTGDVPLSVGLLIDTGSSIGAKFGQVDESIRQSAKIANPADEFFVVKFDREASLTMGFTGDRDPVQRQSAQVGQRGGAILFDAVSLAMRQMREAHSSRKAMLVITEAGSDSAGSASETQRSQELKVIAEFIQSNVRVYGFGSGQPAPFLAELAEQTGGRYLAVGGDAAAVAEAATRIGVEMRNLYGLEYTPRNTLQDGAYRKVQVELNTPRGLPPLKLDYRPGYYESRR
jgi:Ca-activated chloride channel family protein